MEALLKEQLEIGQEIERIIRNFRKDSAVRKTEEKLNTRQLEISTLWRRFEKNHEKLQAFDEEFKDVDYFANNYFNAVKIIVDKMLDDIAVARSSTKKTDESNTKTDSPSIRCVVMMINTLRNLLERTEERLHADQPREYKESQLQAIKKHWEAIQSKHFELLDKANVTDEYDINIFVETESWVERMQLKLLQADTPFEQGKQNIKLPRIQLPKFDGDYLSWQEFHDLFTQLIDNSTLGNAQKLWFLKTNLSGEAEALIRHMTVCDSNYDRAWSLIKERYQNKRLLVNAVLNKLLSQKTINGEAFQEVKSLHDVTQECIRGLQALNISVNQWDPIIIFILLKKLDKTTHVLFEQSLKQPREIPTMSQFLQFLELRFQSLEALGNKNIKQQQKSVSTKHALTVSKINETSCQLCKGNHTINRCETFLAMEIPARRNWVAKKQLCFNCLRSGHNAKSCTSRSCLKCNKKHHTTVHLEKEVTASKNAAQTLASTKPTKETSSYVLLGTALVNVSDHNGSTVTARALLDTGSQLSFISDRLYKKLKINSTAQNQDILGVGNSLQQSDKRVNLRLASKISSFQIEFEAFVLKEITSKHPDRHLNTSNWPLPNGIALADPRFNQPQTVDILLGAELFSSIMKGETISIGKHLPSLHDTVLGWMFLGKVDSTTNEAKFCGAIRNLDEQLERFWEIEELKTSSPPISSEVDKACERFFMDTVARNTTGRYIVRLPFVEQPTALGNSKQIAFQRLRGLQRRFDRNPSLQNDYSDFIQEYLKLGHLELINYIDETKPHYYLPHHCVLRPENTSTKLRVVFDGSAKTTTNKSLNDILRTGPTLQPSLFDILIRFRYHQYVITADIQKMYRQILVHEADRNFQLILWQPQGENKVLTYRLKTVTYGTRCAPYLAIRCLNQLAIDEGNGFPLAAKSIPRDFYVDDLLTGADTLDHAMKLQQQITKVLLKGGFQLHKWCSNHPKLMQTIPSSNQASEFSITKLDTANIIKTLGLSWNPTSDEFTIKISDSSDNRPITKRTVLSEMSQLFDPLGLVNPIIVLAKIFMQQLWELKLDWDTPLPEDLQQKWVMYKQQLPLLQNLRIPRKIRNFSSSNCLQLHGFADASERAYGACIYLRSENQNQSVMVFLVCSKSRVAPIQKRTIARLELCAAQLLVNLANQIKDALNVNITKTFFWTDSKIALQWIASPPSKYTTFVANRVAAIQAATRDGIWQHVESKNNPADIVSRGMLPSQFLSTKLWFEGPTFLRFPIKIQANVGHDDIDAVIPETKATKFVLTIRHTNPGLVQQIHHNNNFQRLQETLAFIIRFTTNCRAKGLKQTSCKPTPSEMNLALKIIIREMQSEDFKAELELLQKQGVVDSNSRLRALAPFLDEEGIIRVGGRISESKLPFSSKHPMVISNCNPISRLIFQHIHEKYLHAGPQSLLYITRQTFWCLNGKVLANATVRRCIRCARARPQVFKQIMGNLPSERIQQARPFLHVGVDFCGPVQIHFQLRGKRPVKAYIALFVCFSTKAVHLELASDLTAAAFIGTLRRFISRRGRPSKIFSDNATNFVGARSELKELATLLHDNSGQDVIDSFCSAEGIQWLHIPPRSPHFGGLWEAAIKSAKYHLKRKLANAPLTYEQLHTVICQIEAVFNSRPLTPMSSNANDLQAITPGHFLIGQPLTTLPESMSRIEQLPLTSRWNLVRSIHAEFWQRWSKEYLQELQHRYKWQTPQPNVTSGTLVVLKEDNLPPLQWRMGRIIETIKGPDNCVRTVIVKTSTGAFTRAIQTLCPLPQNISTPESSASELMESAEEEPKKTKIRIAPVTPTYPTLVQPSKRKSDASPQGTKKGKNMLVQTLVCLLIALPILNPTEAAPSSKPVEISPFSNNPGIFFEEIGSLRLTHNTWKIIMYYEMKGYWIEYEGISKSIIKMRSLCALEESPVNFTQLCHSIVSQFQHVQKEIHERNELLYQHPIYQQRRKRRGLLNIVGSISHSLFGVLDEEFAAKYEQDIEQVRANDQHLLKLMKNQTSIVEGTVNIFKKSIQETHNQISFIEKQIQGFTTTRKYEEIILVFNSIALHTSLALTQFQETQRMLLQLITNTYHGKINPLLLTARQLQEQIQKIREHLPAGQMIPVSSNSMLNLYDIATICTRSTRKNIIFDIRIPLVSVEMYQLLRLYPVPFTYNKTAIHIEPSTEYLAVTLHRDKHYPLSEAERNHCQTFDAEYLICHQSHPIYSSPSDVNDCEMSLLKHHEEIPSTCNIKSSTSENYWRQLASPNKWIFSLKKPSILEVVCSGTWHNERISGSGTLNLQPGCIINQKNMFITSHFSVANKMQFNFTPSINLTDYTLRHEIPPTSASQIYDWTYNTTYLDDLYEKIHHQLTAELPEKISTHDTHNYVINYVSLIIIILICAWGLRKIINTKCRSQNQKKHKTSTDIEILEGEFKVAEDVQ